MCHIDKCTEPFELSCPIKSIYEIQNILTIIELILTIIVIPMALN